MKSVSRILTKSSNLISQTKHITNAFKLKKAALNNIEDVWEPRHKGVQELMRQYLKGSASN